MSDTEAPVACEDVKEHNTFQSAVELFLGYLVFLAVPWAGFTGIYKLQKRTCDSCAGDFTPKRCESCPTLDNLAVVVFYIQRFFLCSLAVGFLLVARFAMTLRGQRVVHKWLSHPLFWSFGLSILLFNLTT